ncbi:hypothetical protein Poly51_14270 [Rubripirellula tenax]|uniref:DUF1571 domain-containing protein n=1 Tax=Rubripirellula tenax TaxID=2528015 RepID=A0A5C6FB43_9BACT|nr:DUF1571 domain-containing protein [Rubripirellula tenax]TWU58648.1 hypothetical protein Poly51_14270 [Rubripirellula tenax]
MFKKILIGSLAIVAIVMLWRRGQTSSAESTSVAIHVDAPDSVSTLTTNVGDNAPTMAMVLDKANASLRRMKQELDDYTARFVKQERDTSGNLSEPSEISMRVQTRFGGPDNRSPRRVYLHFNSPAAVAGREVLWGEDLYDGKMAVHEVGMILGLKTIWLDPNGMIAMQGQRFPISEIGLVKLVEKLIERGEVDRDDSDVTVTITDGHRFDDRDTQRIEVRRKRPNGTEDDFSRAEIVIDPEREWILSYRSFGWPVPGETEAPLLESYAYHDLETNVGLTDIDFDTKNPSYRFPKF